MDKSKIKDILGITEEQEDIYSGRKGPGFRIADELKESIEDKKKKRKGLSI